MFPSQSLFIQGLVRIDFIKGIKSTFVTYFKNDLLIHRSKLERADIFYQKHKNDILRIYGKNTRAFAEIQLAINMLREVYLN